uniref:dystrotelin n=1 Tax=Doryrhamphus excisus TaxID=161450 RepID=UPI0025AE824F|nr:dystrotelin [Doryrhamphus excisus]XP_057941858.1 dystrotelin [Doryrhamphus excisus]XP_057941859.1 dystrotelin [Doryrhamphus excisus]XP_057941860.1 dystrotelin [Doryrhamphus excisus]XP_057941861.1 dystrotelin [Doryrhamphus excisus]
MEDNTLSVESLGEVGMRAYRVAVKLERLQHACHMDRVLLHHISAALDPGGGGVERTCLLSEPEVTRKLNRMFCHSRAEPWSRVTSEASKKICGLMFWMFDRNGSGHIASLSLHIALICLAADTPPRKYQALACAAAGACGSISRSSLRSLLVDMSQVPRLVEQEVVYGEAEEAEEAQETEEAVRLCFAGVRGHALSVDQVQAWLQKQPPLLLWLPLLSHLAGTGTLVHEVRCGICRIRPIRGLRYRCTRCVSFQVCQVCFLSERHKRHHPLMEMTTQPTWRESVSSLVRCAARFLSPRRRGGRGAARGRGLKDSPSSHGASSYESYTGTASHCSSSSSPHTHHMLMEQTLKTGEIQQDSEEVPGRDSEEVPGRDSEEEPGLDSEEVPGRDSEEEPGRDSEEEPGRDSEEEPGRDSEEEPGRDSEEEPGRDSEEEPGRDSEEEPGLDSEEEPGLDSEEEPGWDSEEEPPRRDSKEEPPRRDSKEEPPRRDSKEAPRRDNKEAPRRDSRGSGTPCCEDEDLVEEEVSEKEDTLSTRSHDLHYEEADWAQEEDGGVAESSPEELLQETVDRLTRVLGKDVNEVYLASQHVFHLIGSSQGEGAELNEAAMQVADSLCCLVDTMRQAPPLTGISTWQI